MNFVIHRTLLACLILFGGIIAGCGDAEQSISATPAAALAPLPEGINLTVVEEEKIGEKKSRLFVKISRRISESELKTVAFHLNAERGGANANTYVFFYLPHYSVSESLAWASASAPTGKVTVFGLNPDQAQRLRALPPPEGELMGSWLDDGPPSKRHSIVRRGTQVFALREFENSANTYELRESEAQAGETIRFNYVDYSRARLGEYLVVQASGELEGYNKDGHAFRAERIEIK